MIGAPDADSSVWAQTLCFRVRKTLGAHQPSLVCTASLNNINKHVLPEAAHLLSTPSTCLSCPLPKTVCSKRSLKLHNSRVSSLQQCLRLQRTIKSMSSHAQLRVAQPGKHLTECYMFSLGTMFAMSTANPIMFDEAAGASPCSVCT